MIETLKRFIQSASTEALISYVATFRALKTNKSTAIQCMCELDRRRQNGDNVVYEELIEAQTNIYKNVGKGFIVYVLPDANINDVLSHINELNVNAMIYNKERGLIHIGVPSQEVQEKIITISGVQKIESDKKAMKECY